jgi:hypothetical protein
MKQTTLSRWTPVLISTMLIVAGCAGGASGLDGSSLTLEPVLTSEPTTEEAPPPEVIESPTPVPDLERTTEFTVEPGDHLMTPTPPDGSSSAAAPADLVSSMMTDLAGRLGIDAAQIAVVSATAVTWNDGSLGCPQPGQNYTQALVPGYQVILEAGGKQYPYHASERGGFKLCQGGPGGRRVQPGNPTK